MKRFKLSWLDLGVLTAALGVGLAVRLRDIAQSSIWHDEGYTMMLAPQGPIQIIERTARDVHPPLHYLALHYWMKLFGSSELAARSLSAVFSVLTILVAFFLLRRLFNTYTARIGVVLLAVAPFLVRYAQEARMYSMVAFLLVLATYLLVRAQQDGLRWCWYAYALAMAAAFYTHYYGVFVVPVHWLYVAINTPSYHKRHQVISLGLWQPGWWLSNALIVLLFAPWLPTAYAQFSRVQAAFWIPAVNQLTLPKTISQFLTYTDNLGGLGQAWLIPVGLLMATLFAVTVAFNRKQWKSYALLILLAGLAPAAVFVLSFKRPIYIDRYFVFAAAGYYMLLAAVIASKPWRQLAWLPIVATLSLVGLFGYGLRNVDQQASHQMRAVASQVNAQYQPGDVLVAGELYVYFDFSYYNHTGTLAQLLAPDGVSGFGESSLLYDGADQIVVKDLRQLRPDSGYVWVIGKTGPHNYFDQVPGTWETAGPKIEAGYSAAQRYRVGTSRALTLGHVQ